MASHIDFGNHAERLAQAYLEHQGYTIVECNWWAGRGRGCLGEIDIIARKANTLSFVEVKARNNEITSGDFSPQAAFSMAKKERMLCAAQQYLMLLNNGNEPQLQVQLELIAINFLPDGSHALRHYPIEL
ncbi:MAG: YraN family protein [Mucinivorans sp.]